MNFKTQVAKGLKWQALSILGKQLLSLVVFTTLARILDPEAFGLVGLVSVYLFFVGMFADQGIGAALIQRKILDKAHKDTAFWTNIGCSILLCLGTIALADPVSKLFGDARLAPLLRWSSIGLIITALSAIHETLLHKDMDFRSPTIRILIANSLGGAVGVIMALCGYGVWALVAQQLTAASSGAIFLWVVSSYRPSFNFSVRHFRELSSVGWSIFSTSLLWFLVSRVDQIVIGRFIGIPQLGFYVIGNKIPDMAKTLTQSPLETISLPALARLQDDHTQMCDTIYQGMELNATVSFAIFVGLSAISSDLVPFLFGAKWASSAVFTSLLCIYSLVNVLQVFFYPAMLSSGGAGRSLIFSVYHAGGALISCMLGVYFGINYLICGMMLTSMILATPAILFLKERVGLQPIRYWKPCLVPALAAISMVCLIWMVSLIISQEISVAVLIACKIIVGAIGYLGFIFIFKRSSLVKIANTVRLAVKRSAPEPA